MAAATTLALEVIRRGSGEGIAAEEVINAVSEAFNSILKFEYAHRHTFAARTEARIGIATWITDFYNTRRLHSVCSFKSPIDHERPPSGRQFSTMASPGLPIHTLQWCRIHQMIPATSPEPTAVELPRTRPNRAVRLSRRTVRLRPGLWPALKPGPLFVRASISLFIVILS
ncbi:integrase core domain-containing protein [Streptomyces sp. NPDC020951]|uniref:integrase core domain-containing protein n=1 Tax=Streptomyces sp. NPDC020951 TaxID=3365104 RepID=UPI0037AD1EC4